MFRRSQFHQDSKVLKCLSPVPPEKISGGSAPESSHVACNHTHKPSRSIAVILSRRVSSDGNPGGGLIFIDFDFGGERGFQEPVVELLKFSPLLEISIEGMQ